jgi:NADH:ubiquinone oxidoreductase subunit D
VFGWWILDGEVSAQTVMGYPHRNHEKIAERNTFPQNMPLPTA